MARYALHVPERLNDGSLIPSDYFVALEHELIALARGFTRTSATGGWRGVGDMHRDPVALYFIDTSDQRAGARLLDIAQRIARELAQEAVYVTRQEIDTFVVAAMPPITQQHIVAPVQVGSAQSSGMQR